MAIFDSTEEHPPAKIRRYIITGLAFAVLAALFCAYLLRYHTEKNTIRHFLSSVAAGNLDEAYRTWKPTETYSMKDFLEDWGPNGYYGPVKSYHIENTEQAKGGSEVIAVVELSPYAPFPTKDDFAKQSKTKEVRLWVEVKNQSITFAP